MNLHTDLLSPVGLEDLAAIGMNSVNFGSLGSGIALGTEGVDVGTVAGASASRVDVSSNLLVFITLIFLVALLYLLNRKALRV